MKKKELDLIKHEVNSQLIVQRASDGAVDATALCKAASLQSGKHKRFSEYRKLTSTQEFINELSAETGIPILQLIQPVTNHLGIKSNFVHPQVAIHLAQWASPKFAVLVSKWVFDWMSGHTSQTPIKLNEWQQNIVERLEMNLGDPTDPFFYIENEIKDIALRLAKAGLPADQHTILDGSVGSCWGPYWTKNNLHELYGEREDREYFYPGQYAQATAVKPIYVKVYPLAAMEQFRKWVWQEYIPKKLPPYLKRKLSQGTVTEEIVLKIVSTLTQIVKK